MTQIEGERLYRAAVKAHRQRDLMTAGALYSRFVSVNPRLPAAWDQLGLILAELGNLRDAEECWTGIVRHMPDYQYMARVHSQLCWLCFTQGREEAIAHGRKAVEVDPKMGDGWLNLGIALEALEELEEAMHCFQQAKAVGSREYQYSMYRLKRSICAWDGMEALERDLLNPKYEWQPGMLLEYFGYLRTDPVSQRRTAAKAVRRTPHRPLFPVGRPHKVKDRKIRLGFLSSDFRDHAASTLIVSTFENFDREKFELHAFSIGPADDGEYNRRIRRAMTQFHDLQHMIDTEIVEQINKCGIDILFDICGYTRGNRWGIVARRPAPVQISFLAWPGTMGGDFIDYMVVDPIVAPERTWFTEKPLSLDCYWPTDDKRAEPVARSRSELGLPEGAIILTSMNSTMKITPTMMTLWCEILREVPSAILWQLESNPVAGRNLMEFARQHGVADRFVLAPKLSVRDHIDRIGVADLGLDAFPYGGHTTTSDLLWAAVPVVALVGESFVSRVATSLLNAAGVPELSTTSLAEYKALILALCRDRSRLAALKTQLNATRHSSLLFDNKRYTKGLEAKLIEIVS